MHDKVQKRGCRAAHEATHATDLHLEEDQGEQFERLQCHAQKVATHAPIVKVSHYQARAPSRLETDSITQV